jgi:CMP-N-acetylneuraminic acid synthetase
MRVVAIIPAKGNSRRLPKKNIYPVWGKPMLYWAIKACEESKYNIEPWISTEDSEVEEVAKSFGAKIHRRDLELSDSKTYKQAVIRSAAGYISFIRGSEVDIFISLQPNSPQIKAEHLDNAIDVLLKHERHEVFSVDNNLMQNAAFRIFKGDYVFQEDLSTNCGVVVCDLHDVHTIEDVRYLEK